MTSCATIPNKNWVDSRIDEKITQYEQKDRQWTKERYEETIPQEQLLTALNSTYQVINEACYKTSKGEIIESPYSKLGSGALFKGGYLLTAKHTTEEGYPKSNHPFFSQAKYAYNRFTITDKIYYKATKRYELEKIIEGKERIILAENEKILAGKSLDYALLKLKDDAELPYYSYGLDIADKIEPCKQSIAIGFPAGGDKNLRLGNVAQVDSDLGEDYLTFKNSLITGDSGGPIFIVKDGDLKLVALSGSVAAIEDFNSTGQHPTNIGYGLKISSIVKDLEEQLKLGKLDKKTSKEIKKFLELNVR